MHSAASDIIDIHPATPLQMGMLYHALSKPGSAVFLQHYAMYVDGPFRPDFYVAAWQMVADRHPALRSSFHWRGLDRCLQAVARQAPIPTRFEDLTALPEDKRQARLLDLVREDRHLAFDLERPPLMRVMVVALAEQRHAVVVGFHHVVADGWSLGIAMDEVARFYTALSRGETADLPPAPPFRRYADWLATVDMAAARTYWQDRLEGATPSRLPYRQPPQTDDTPDALCYHDLYLTEAETTALAAGAKAAGVTLATVMQGAWALLLARFERQDRVLFAMSNANRPAVVPGIDRIFGPLMAVLPCNLVLDDSQPVGAFLAQLQRDQIIAREHDYLSPAEHQRLARISPLDEFLTSMLVLEDMPTADGAAWSALGLRFRELSTYDRTTYPLNMFVYPGARILLRLGVDARQFPVADAQRIVAFMRHLVLALAADPARSLSAVALPAAAAEDARLAGPPAPAQAGLWDRIEAGLARPGMAVEDTSGRLLADGAALAARAAKIDSQLDAAGVAAGDSVALWQDTGLDYIAAVLAAIRRGSAYALIDPLLPAGVVPGRLRDVGIAVVITTADRAATLSGGGLIVIVAGDGGDRTPPLPRPAAEPQAPAVIVWTSGSTGTAKAPVIVQAALMNRLDWGRTVYPAEDRPRTLLKTSPAFVDSVAELLQPLADGHTAILPDPEAARAPEGLVQAMRDGAATRLVVTPSFLRAMLAVNSAPSQPWPLRRLHISGEALPGDLPHKLQAVLSQDCVVLNIYGSAEVTADLTACQVGLRDHDAAVPIGLPLPGCGVWLLDPQGQPVPRGAVGEVHADGLCLASGYAAAGDDRRFRDWLTPAGGTVRVYATGDLARLDPDGALVHMGRADAQIKIRGVRIEPAEVEARMTELPQVAEAVVTVWPTADGPRLIGYVQPSAQAGADHDSRVSAWQSLYDGNYANLDNALDDFRIWQSAITGAPLPADEMRSWVHQTIALAREALPGRANASLVEVGCGQGLLLGRMAQDFAAYLGTDISAEALDRVRQLQAATPGLGHVRLAQLAADTPLPPDAVPQGGFDTALLSSVVQYFPDGDYLVRTLRTLIPSMARGGRIILSDLRGLHLRDLLAAEILLARSEDVTDPAALRQRLRDMAVREPELLVDPALFGALGQLLPRLACCEVRPKAGPEDNELTRFRYDAVLYLDDAPAGVYAPAVAWAGEEAAGNLLASGGAVMLTGIPRPTLGPARVALSLIDRDDLRDAADWRSRAAAASKESLGLEPHQLHQLAARHGARAAIGVDPDDPQRLIARFDRGGDSGAPHPAWPMGRASDIAACFNRPYSADAARELADLVSAHLRRSLPPGLVPDQIITVDDWPRSASQKMVRRLLPRPSVEAVRGDVDPPRTPTEIALADLWRRVLNTSGIGRETGFFEVGGNSLSLTQLAFSIGNAFGIRFPLAAAFAEPVLHRMAARIDSIVVGDPATAATDDADRLAADAAIADPIPAPQGFDGRMWPAEGVGTILHTGAGGALSHWVLRRLLADPGLRVLTLGGGTPEQVRHGLAQAWQDLGFGRLDLLDRLEIVPGTLDRPAFGLSAAAWQSLARDTDVILHSGIHIDMAANYGRLRMANVLGTREVLRLAASGNGIPVHALGSFATISHADAATARLTIDEAATLPDPSGLENDYRKSRWASEVMLTRAAARGLPVALYRIPLLGGTRDGLVPDPDEVLWRVVRAMIAVGAAPPGDRPLDMLPIDEAVEAVLALARGHGARSGVHHVIGDGGVTWDDVAAATRDCGYPVQPVSGRDWAGLLRRHVARQPQDAGLTGLLPLVHDEGNDHQAFHAIDGTATRALLRDAGHTEARAAGRGQIADWVANLRQRGLLPAPAVLTEEDA